MKSKIFDKSVKRLGIVTVVALSVAILSVVGVSVYFFKDMAYERELIVIPSYVGRNFDKITSSDKIRIESEPVFSNEAPVGEVISQFPYGGSKRKLKEGEKYVVKLTVSLGKETQSVPELKNYKYTDAASALRKIGAEIRIVSVYDDSAESDTVLRTSPAAGEKISGGDTVTLFVSRNHVKGSVCVKNFIGMEREEAVSEILAQGLTLGEIGEEYSEIYPKGTVISQSIIPERYVLYGEKIDIILSTGEREEDLHPFRKDIIQNNGEINESID